MKKYFLILLSSLLLFSVSCEKEKKKGNDETEMYIDATSKTTWHYYSFDQKEVVGTGAENATDNATWGAKKNWDIAISGYYVRTNSGEFTTVGAQGGVYTCEENTDYTSVTALPTSTTFVADTEVTVTGMGGTSVIVKSEAAVIQFKKNTDGSLIMPPVYLQSPVYVFRTADGSAQYKLLFTQYKNEDNVTGHVRFKTVKL